MNKPSYVITAEELINMKFPEKKVFGKWEITDEGDMSYDRDRYFISGDRLQEDEWIIHLMGKRWIDWNDFIPAYIQALRNKKQQFVTIKTYY